MTPSQWETLLRVVAGQTVDPLPVALVIDSPWLPGWFGVSALDYYASETVWYEANTAAVRAFPEVIFLPGFWAEFGMCTEPSAFGCKCVWREDSLAFPAPALMDVSQIDRLRKPDITTDGLLPFVMRRLQRRRADIEAQGHRIKFAVSRGPLNIASFLLGTTEFLTALKTDAARIHRLLDLVSDFVAEWLIHQARTFETIEAVFLLDDIIGFLGEDDYTTFVVPYFRQIYARCGARLNVLHNDASGLITARHLEAMSVDLYHFSADHSLETVRRLAGPRVTLLGNLPPRQVLAEGTVQQVRQAVDASVGRLRQRSRLIVSCGGGVPPGVPTSNIHACVEAVRGINSPMGRED